MWIPDYVNNSEQWIDLMLTQLLVIANAIFLSIVLYQAKASRSYSALPIPLMILTTAVLPDMRSTWLLQLWMFIILMFLFLMQQLSENQSPNSYVFFVSLLLCILTIWIPDAVWCLLYLWLVVLQCSAFSLRTIFASAIAVAVFAIYYGIAYHLGWVSELPLDSLLDRSWFADYASVRHLVSVSVVLVSTFAIMFASFRRSSYDFVSTRMLLYHCAMLYIVATPFILLSKPEGAVMHAMLALATPAVTGIYLLQKESESRGITFLLYVLVALALYAPIPGF